MYQSNKTINILNQHIFISVRPYSGVTSKEIKLLKNMIESEKLVIQPLPNIRGRRF